MGAADEDWDPDVRVSLDLRDPNGDSDTIALETHVLGLSPYLLIKPEVSDDEVVFNVTGTRFDLDDVKLALETIMAAIEQHQEREGG